MVDSNGLQNVRQCPDLNRAMRRDSYVMFAVNVCSDVQV